MSSLENCSLSSDRSPDVDISDDEEGAEEYWSNDDMSDSEPNVDEDGRPSRNRKSARGPVRPTVTRVH